MNFLFVYLNTWTPQLTVGKHSSHQNVCLTFVCVCVCVSIEGYYVLVFVEILPGPCPSKTIVLKCLWVYFILCRLYYTCINMFFVLFFNCFSFIEAKLLCEPVCPALAHLLTESWV